MSLNFIKINKNKKYAELLGWQPSWFGCDLFDSFLIEKIKFFQAAHDLIVDGLCGPMTTRRLELEKDAEVIDVKEYVLCSGIKVPVPGTKIITLDEKGALHLPESCYRKTFRKNPTMIVTHFDVALSAESCYRILKKRNISSHFVIDNDGTIYQMVDTAYEAWHAGNRAVNKASIGIDISNAYYTKYNSRYEKMGFGKRPVLRDLKVHGQTLAECLGFYPQQLEAYSRLVETLCQHYNIPLEYPQDPSGALLRGVYEDASKARFKGIINHYHITKRKIDCVNLDLGKIIDQLKNRVA